MKYLIIGTGGTGAAIGGFLASKDKDVTFIARGKNFEQLKQNGLKLKSGVRGDIYIPNIKVVSEEEYKDKADVIFVCVKTYSIEEVIPFIRKASHDSTIIIPTANGFGIGDKLSATLNNLHVIDGCIYISAFMEAPGTFVQLGNFFKIVFGPRKGDPVDPDILNEIKNNLSDSGINTILSDNILRDTFKKFTFISTLASCAAYYDITSGGIQREGMYRETFKELCKEIEKIGYEMGLELDSDIVEENLKIVDSTNPDTTSSLQKDMKEGKKSEIDGLIFEVVRLADKYGVEAPFYTSIAKYFGYTIK